MRIVAGKYGGRVLNTPKNNDIRPTSDKVRGAIFNALQSRGVVKDAYVGDLFCGSGALGLEALSQGASACLFVDKAKSSLELAKQNATQLGAQAQFLLKDSTKFSPCPENQNAITLVFLDPPYNKDLVAPTLEALINENWLAEKAFIVVETGRNETFATPPQLTPDGEKIYGETKIWFLQNA